MLKKNVFSVSVTMEKNKVHFPVSNTQVNAMSMNMRVNNAGGIKTKVMSA